jgi:hypothetical protein
MASADLSLVKDWVSLEITPQLYDQIRALWAYHCDRENNSDIDGLLTTLTDDCEYHLVNLGVKWHGHEGARGFYEELLNAFIDVLWVPEALVIGPQGVFDVVVLNGKQLQGLGWDQGEWRTSLCAFSHLVPVEHAARQIFRRTDISSNGHTGNCVAA